jgi:hypothetical protein
MDNNMKKLILVFLLMFFVTSIDAQPYNSLNEEQLNLSLDNAKIKIKKGSRATLIGGIAGITGVALLPFSKSRIDVEGNSSYGARIAVGYCLIGYSIVSISIGVPKWINGGVKRKKIELELVKFKNTASINGVGVKVRF